MILLMTVIAVLAFAVICAALDDDTQRALTTPKRVPFAERVRMSPNACTRQTDVHLAEAVAENLIADSDALLATATTRHDRAVAEYDRIWNAIEAHPKGLVLLDDSKHPLVKELRKAYREFAAARDAHEREDALNVAAWARRARLNEYL